MVGLENRIDNKITSLRGKHIYQQGVDMKIGIIASRGYIGRTER